MHIKRLAHRQLERHLRSSFFISPLILDIPVGFHSQIPIAYTTDMTPLPEWMQPLFSAGVLQDVLSSSGENLPNPPIALNSISQSNIEVVAKEVDATSNIIPPPGPTQPPSEPQIKVKRSAMLKAYAHSIRGLMTPDSDLSATRQALFIANPLQKGIPIGVNQEFVNEAIFQHGNAVQSPLTPIYRSGVGNYFDILNK
jgi:hypothetical protein